MVLSANRKAELKKITIQSPGFKCQGDLGCFFDLFLVCEAIARILISYYKNEISKAENHNYSITEVKAALNLFSISIMPNDDFVTYIFKSGSGTRGKKTCRQLRNDYIHNLSQFDRVEIESRNIDLKENMNKWIQIFQ